jgi:hypothetical protein
MNKVKTLLKRGDTILEVTFAISVFSLVSVLSLQLMDRDVAIVQGALESEMARNEIDAQAEALRFIQNSYASERELSSSKREYEKLWLKLSRSQNTVIDGQSGSGIANEPSSVSEYFSETCSKYYDQNNRTNPLHNIFEDRAFVINTRNLNPNDINGTIIQSRAGGNNNTDVFKNSTLYPRIVYSGGSSPDLTTDDTNLSEEADNPTYQNQSVTSRAYDKVVRAEGIWVISSRARTIGSTDASPEFYDFHIRTCWFAPGHERPSTIGTTIRLYNPEYIEAQR